MHCIMMYESTVAYFFYWIGEEEEGGGGVSPSPVAASAYIIEAKDLGVL